MRNIAQRLAASTSIFAVALLTMPGMASAQTEQDQVEAERVNDEVACSTIADAQERADCLARGGENALPQAGAPNEDAIVVTGSRIARPNYDTINPTVVLDSAQIESRGFATLGEALNEQPTFGVPGASPVGAAQGGSFGSGQSFVNFLGLGDQRTLTLVNGRRFVSSNTASIFGPSNAGSQVDLNLINTQLVDRIETQAIGGAPIYGSDAIAGTVNVILKRNYDGVEIDGQYGVSERGDAANYRVRAIAGTNFADDRGNIVISGEFNEGDGLVFNDRGITAAGNFYADCPPGSEFNQCFFPDRRIPSISESGILTVGGDVFGLNFPLSPAQSEFLVFGDPSANFGVQDANGNQLQFNPAGNLIPIDFGSPVGDIEGGDFNIDFSGGNGFNINNTSQLLTDTRRYNANILTQFQLTDNVRLFGEGWYAFSRGVNLRSQPVYNSGLFDSAGTPDGPIILSVNNPFLTAEQRGLIVNSINNNPFSDVNQGVVDAQDYFYLSRANTDLVSGRASSETQLYRFVGGIDGNFEIGERRFNYEIVGNYGRATSAGREPVLVQQNFENAVNAVRDASGNVVCAPGAVNASIPTLSSTCAPLNLFGNGRISQAARDYVTAIADPRSENEQWVVTASIAGPVFRLPGGDFNIALGYEHRDEQTSFDPGDFFFGGDDPDPATDANGDGDPANDRQQFGRSIPILPVSGGFNTDEVFGEIRADIFSASNNVPAIYSLEFQAAARYVDHSTAGKDVTYTVGIRYAPIRDLALRGNFTRAIRAPAITETFNPSSTFFGFANDPCDSDNLGSGPDPATRQANCAAAGIAPTFQSLSNQRSFLQASAGNVQLENEKSDAYQVGAVLTPTFLRGFTASVDYLDIKLKDAISNFSATQVVNSCFDSGDFAGNPFCSLIQRGADDQLSFIQTRFFNAAQFRYKGIIGSLDYRTASPALGANSRIGVNVSYQYLDTLTSQSDPASAATTLDGSIGYPRHSANLNINYENEGFGLSTSFNYVGEVNLDPDEPEGLREFANVNDVVFVNVGAVFDIAERMKFRIVVDNLFDQDPPFPVPAFGGSVTYFPGVLGRFYRLGASVRF